MIFPRTAQINITTSLYTTIIVLARSATVAVYERNILVIYTILVQQ